ncbi:FadR/GntR family transcriptional regulator [Phytohabitans kaempferiae]|uniref:FadR/GntR family transcriptional regulator n=1 Tax=Phytohabitans kaempferiae TaxID=1620943 RepID=A0ABV6MHJ7_9ACTN
MPGRSGSVATAYDRLAEAIRDQILAGELRPGDRLPTEPEMSSRFKVSRSTAREALRALASQGFVTIRRGVAGGVFVAPPDPEQVSETLQNSLVRLTAGTHVSIAALLEMRELLEVPAAEMAALRHTTQEISAIRQALFDPDQVDPATVFTSNRDFHIAVLRAAHNPMIEMVVEPIFAVIKERLLRDRAPERFWHQVDADHREILGHLEARDQAGAREAARAHLRYLTRTYKRIDRELNPGD